MTWTAPMTAVSGNVLTASQFNTYVRDNLNETAVAKATTTAQYFVTTATNQITARKIASSYSTVIDSTTSGGGTYVDLDNSQGPSVSAITGTTAIVCISAEMSNTSDQFYCGCTYEVSGATSIPATGGARGVAVDGMAGGATPLTNASRWGAMFHESGTLNPGTNVFTMKYTGSSSGGTAYFNRREIIVMPL